MPRTPQLVRPLDSQLVRLFVEQQSLDNETFRMLSQFVPEHERLCARSSRRTTQRLRQAGLLVADRRMAGPLISYPTRAGARFAGLDVPVGRVALSQLNHTLTCARVRVHYARAGYVWLSESVLRSSGWSGHLPDGVAYTPDGLHVCLVEVELTQKSMSRTQAIFDDLEATARSRGPSSISLPSLSSSPVDWCIDYWVNTDTERHIRGALGQRGAPAQYRLFRSDLGVAKAT